MNRPDRPGREENNAEFRAFAADAELFFGEIDLVAVETGEFGNTESGGKQELEDSAVATDADTLAFWGGEEALDLIVLEEVDLALRDASDFDLFSRERLDIVRW